MRKGCLKTGACFIGSSFKAGFYGNEGNIMKKETRQHIKVQFLMSGISNAVLNSLFTWLTNRSKSFTPYSGVIADTFFTTGFVSCLVTLPTAYFTHKAIRAGLLLIEEENKIVNSLPRKFLWLWLLLWLVFFILLELLFFIVFKLLGMNGINFWPLLITKFIVYGLMGGFLGAFVSYRFLQPK